jgi:hypothetical protein
MDEQLKTTSTSPDSSMFLPQYSMFFLNRFQLFFYLVFSEFSSHDSAVNVGSVPTLSAMSVLSPLRSSVTLANMSNVTNTLDHQGFFFDEFNSQQSSSMSRW